jgi:4-hydroxybenzoate polyprenyltransferase
MRTISIHRYFQKFVDFLVLIRFATTGITIVMPMLGAIGASRYLTLHQIVGIICIGLSWHIFAHVSNDVVDLELDKNQPDRSDSPLVSGRVKPRQALTLALAQIPISLLITVWLSHSAVAYVYWLIAFAFMGIYNIWGKKLRLSLLTDFIQGCSWASLGLYGSAVVGSLPTVLNLGLFVYLVGFILMASGIHGTVRDLPNDLTHNKKTTAMLFGAKPNSIGDVTLPVGLKIYGAFIQLWLHASVLVPLFANWFRYDTLEWGVTFIFEAMLILSAWCLLAQIPWTINNFPKLYQVGLYHLLVSYLSLLILYTFYMGLPMLFLLLAFIILPLFTINWKRDSFTASLKTAN